MKSAGIHSRRHKAFKVTTKFKKDGYSFSPKIDTKLTLEALAMVVRREKSAKGLLHHTDRGAQYASSEYRAKLKQLGFLSSMSRTGNPFDNAIAENFFSCLKCELVHLTHFYTRKQAENEIYAYI